MGDSAPDADDIDMNDCTLTKESIKSHSYPIRLSNEISSDITAHDTVHDIVFNQTGSTNTDDNDDLEVGDQNYQTAVNNKHLKKS